MAVAIYAICQSLLLLLHTAEHAALLADSLGQRARVDAVHGRNVLFLEPCSQRRGRKEVREVFTRVRGRDEAGDVDLRGLEVRRQVSKQLVKRGPRWDTVVANERKRNNKDLASVGRVGYRLGVPNHACLENKLSSDAPGGAEAITLIDRAILELETDHPAAVSLGEGHRGRAVHKGRHCGRRKTARGMMAGERSDDKWFSGAAWEDSWTLSNCSGAASRQFATRLLELTGELSSVCSHGIGMNEFLREREKNKKSFVVEENFESSCPAIRPKPRPPKIFQLRGHPVVLWGTWA